VTRPAPDVFAELAPRFGADPARLVFLGGGQEWSDGTLYSFPSGGIDRVIKFIAVPDADREGLERARDRETWTRLAGASEKAGKGRTNRA
jgi:hypothetical protein